MYRLLRALALVSLSACVQLGQAADSDSDSDSGSAANAGSGATGVAANAAATGTNCGVDPGSGVSLCLGSSSCPGLRVDPAQFPGCGYRISGTTIDLECLCGEALCPMGSAASCLDAKALLTEQSALGVCAAVADGRCETVEPIHSDSNNSTCDKNCRSHCSGDPNCFTLCGC